MPRAYQSVDASRISDPKVRAIIEEIDATLFDLTRSTPSSTESGASSPNDLTYLTVSPETGLANSRRLTATAPLVRTDGGAGGALNLSLNATALGAAWGASWGTAVAAGSAGTFIRSDATLKYPDKLLDAAGGTLAFTQSAGNQILTGDTGKLSIVPATFAEILKGTTIRNPSGSSTVLNLQQYSTGAVDGAHLNFDDKGGDDPNPIEGDMWRHGFRLRMYYNSLRFGEDGGSNTRVMEWNSPGGLGTLSWIVSGAYTLNLPERDGDLIHDGFSGSALVQRMKNKRLQDATTFFINEADEDIGFRFQCADLPTGDPNLDAEHAVINIPIDCGRNHDPAPSQSDMLLNDTDQDVQNKNFEDSTTTFYDETNTGAQMRFELSGLTDPSTRVLTIQDASGTLAYLADVAAVTVDRLTSANSILVLTDNITDQTLTGDTGNLNLVASSGDILLPGNVLTINSTGTASAQATAVYAFNNTFSGTASCLRFEMQARANSVTAYGIRGKTVARSGNTGLVQIPIRGEVSLRNPGTTISVLKHFQAALEHISTDATSVVTNRYGLYLEPNKTDATYTNTYGAHVPDIEFGTNRWAFYSEVDDSFLGEDNAKTYWGTARDCSIYYDGTNMILQPQDVGSGFVSIGTGASGGTDRKLRCGECMVTGALNHDGSTAGFFNTSPVAQAAAYTQTYATAAREVTAIAVTNLVLAPTSGGWGWATEAQAQAVDDQLNGLVSDITNLKQIVNALIDDLQSYGLVQ